MAEESHRKEHGDNTSEMKAGSYFPYLSCINTFLPLSKISWKFLGEAGEDAGCLGDHRTLNPSSREMMQPWDIQQVRRGTGKAVGTWTQTGANPPESCLGYTCPKA